MNIPPVATNSGVKPGALAGEAGAWIAEMAQTNLEMLMEVSLQLSVELGQTQMSVRQVLDLQQGSVVELNRQAGDAVDIFVNNHIFARGEVVVVDDKFGVRITELVSPVQKKL